MSNTEKTLVRRWLVAADRLERARLEAQVVELTRETAQRAADVARDEMTDEMDGWWDEELAEDIAGEHFDALCQQLIGWGIPVASLAWRTARRTYLGALGGALVATR